MGQTRLRAVTPQELRGQLWPLRGQALLPLPCLAGEAAAVTRELPSPRGLWAGQWGQLCPQTWRPQDSAARHAEAAWPGPSLQVRLAGAGSP